eukprot:2748762-Prymnesium_polylepis.1
MRVRSRFDQHRGAIFRATPADRALDEKQPSGAHKHCARTVVTVQCDAHQGGETAVADHKRSFGGWVGAGASAQMLRVVSSGCRLDATIHEPEVTAVHEKSAEEPNIQDVHGRRAVVHRDQNRVIGA